MKAFTIKAFEQMGFKATDSQTNFIFVNINRPAAAFRDACREAGVMVGRDFPPYEKTHCRISIGTQQEMERAVGVFKKVLVGQHEHGEPGAAVTGIEKVKEDSAMSLSRRRFVQNVGAGAAGFWVAGRGREAGLFDLGFDALHAQTRLRRSSWPATRIRWARAVRCSTPSARGSVSLGAISSPRPPKSPS